MKNTHHIEPHIYTQEEALSMRKQIYDLNQIAAKQLDEIEERKNKLDVALQIMSKEQLIEFIKQTM